MRTTKQRKSVTSNPSSLNELPVNPVFSEKEALKSLTWLHLFRDLDVEIVDYKITDNDSLFQPSLF